jgi:chorismate mutase
MPTLCFRFFVRLAASTAACLSLMAGAVAQPTSSGQRADFSKLVELSATRLEISRKVALTKWDTGHPVSDPPGDPREKAVIESAAAEAVGRGVSRELATAFFADHIEASTLVQIGLIAGWRRTGHVPTEPRADLRAELRPALDRLRSIVLDELYATGNLRALPGCKTQLAIETGAYAKAHDMPPLFAVALDRGLARVCGD